LPFKEKEILDINILLLKKEANADEIVLLDADEAAKSGNKVLVNFANNATPGDPQVMLEWEQNEDNLVVFKVCLWFVMCFFLFKYNW